MVIALSNVRFRGKADIGLRLFTVRSLDAVEGTTLRHQSAKG
jgi:hypothetical protein